MYHMDVLFLNRETLERLLAQITFVARVIEIRMVSALAASGLSRSRARSGLV